MNRKLILSNLKYFSWRSSYLNLKKDLSYKWGLQDTKFFLKLDKETQAFRDYAVIFKNKQYSYLGVSAFDDINYVKLNIDIIPEVDIFHTVLDLSINMWGNGIPFIAWLYHYYPKYYISFSNLELSYINYWFQSSFVLDEVVKLSGYKPHVAHIPDNLMRLGVLNFIPRKLFLRKYIFEVLLFWWNNQDIKSLTINFPFDITLLSKEAQLYFYIYHSFSTLSSDTLMILDYNMCDYPPFDDTEKNIFIDFKTKQNLNLTNIENEIHKIYNPFMTNSAIADQVNPLKLNKKS